jgi:outer membrane protein assembly factor BamE
MYLVLQAARGSAARQGIGYDYRMRIIPLIAAVCVLSGCVYSMPIQQGNFLDPAAIVQVKVGMTRSQVRYLLGTPMVPGAFDDSRWDYDYYFKGRRLQTPRRGHVVVRFVNNLVSGVDSDVKSSPLALLGTGADTRPAAAGNARSRPLGGTAS